MDAKQLRKDMALWIIRLNADDPDERQQAQIEFEAWKIRHPEYQGQLDQMLNFSETMQQLSVTHGIASQNIQDSMQVSRQSSQQIQQLFTKAFMLCLSVGAAGYIAHNSAVFSYYTAGLKTDTGEMQSFILEDGSKITLGAKSAIKLDFKPGKRQINLVQGDLYIDVAKDRNRPLIIHTPQADFKALGTRFIVHQYASSSTLSMLHSKVETRSSGASHALKVVQQGETLTADAQGLSEISALSIPSAELAWQKHQILADNLPLSDLLTRLGRYHHQYLAFNHSALSRYKVSGVINTRQDLDKTLSLLLVQHPQLKIRKIGSHVIWITANE